VVTTARTKRGSEKRGPVKVSWAEGCIGYRSGGGCVWACCRVLWGVFKRVIDL
jgi:hypothetical protein